MAVNHVKQQSEAIATRVGQHRALVGFDPISLITIITTLLPMIIQLFNGGLCPNRDDDETDPVEFVNRHYNERTGKYSKKLLERTAKEAMKAARKEGKRLSKDAAQVVAFETLEQTRTAGRKVGLVMNQVSA